MKIQKFLIIGMLAAAFSGLSVGASQALDCATGFEPNGMSECAPIEPIAITATDGETVDPDPTPYSVSNTAIDENGCWTNVDAAGNPESYVCSRSAVPMLTSEKPLDPAVGCGTVVDENGVDNTVCADVMYSGGPVDDNGVPIMEKGYDLMSANGLAMPKTQSDSNILAALGVLIAAAAAFAIGLSKERSKKS